MAATIYLDNAASTPVDPRVAALMAEVLRDPAAQANPASATHAPGRAASARIEAARVEVASLLGATPREIIFTSGATEANNLALLGVAQAARRAGRGGHFVSSRIEHKSVLDACRQLERDGFAVTLVEPDESGRVPPEAFRLALREDTLLVSSMLANNETGVLNDIAALGVLCRSRGVLLHSDASQAVGKLPVDVAALGVDFLSCTAHKLYGPKGIGALFVREDARPRIAPLLHGGGHERNLRAGTLATHQVAGFGAACALAGAQLAADAAHARDLAGRLWRELENLPGVLFNGQGAERVPGLLNLSFEGVEGESLVAGLGELALSTGSACSSATREPSYVLRALGRNTELAQSSLRISVGRFNAAPDVDLAAAAIIREVSRLRVLAGGTALQGAPGAPDAPAAVLGLNPAAARYFRAAARVPRFPQGGAPAGIRQGRAGRQADGTEVSFELEIAAAPDGGKIVNGTRFTAYGCPHTVAVVAWIAEVLEGSRLDAGMPGTPAQWAARFEVPVEKLGRLLIVEDALRAALR